MKNSYQYNTRTLMLVAGVLLAGAVALGGCGMISRTVAHYTGHSEQCVDGVAYLQFPSGATVKYDRAGKVVTCN